MLLLIAHKLAVTIQIMLEFTSKAKPERRIRPSILYGALLFFLLIFSEGRHAATEKVLKCKMG